ncbi:MAG: hypothetical protein ACRDNK_24375 [Solirubrobacteraceae bacterium]
MTGPELPFEDLMGLWQDGERRLRGAEPGDRIVLERIVAQVVDELRRRIGASFGVQELARYYVQEGTDWCFGIATRVAPGTPAAWDITTVSGAAFARYAREAGDYRFGRRTAEG